MKNNKDYFVNSYNEFVENLRVDFFHKFRRELGLIIRDIKDVKYYDNDTKIVINTTQSEYEKIYGLVIEFGDINFDIYKDIDIDLFDYDDCENEEGTKVEIGIYKGAAHYNDETNKILTIVINL